MSNDYWRDAWIDLKDPRGVGQQLHDSSPCVWREMPKTTQPRRPKQIGGARHNRMKNYDNLASVEY